MEGRRRRLSLQEMRGKGRNNRPGRGISFNPFYALGMAGREGQKATAATWGVRPAACSNAAALPEVDGHRLGAGAGFEVAQLFGEMLQWRQIEVEARTLFVCDDASRSFRAIYVPH